MCTDIPVLFHREDGDRSLEGQGEESPLLIMVKEHIVFQM